MNMNMNMNAVKIEKLHELNGHAIWSMANPVADFIVGHTDLEWAETKAVNKAVDVIRYSELSHNDLVEYVKIFSVYAGVNIEDEDLEDLEECLYSIYTGYFYKKYPPVSEVEVWDTEYESTLPYGSLARPGRRSSKRVRSVRRNSNKTFRKED